MDKLTTLNLTFDRVLIQLITPGIIAGFPYILLFFNERPDVRDFFLTENKGLLLTFIVLVALVMGIILENFGSRIEVLFYDKRHSKKKSDYYDIWKKFLLISYEDSEPIGQRYLRNILFRMKFELSTGVGLIFMTLGLGIYNLTNTIFDSSTLNCFVVYILPLGTSIYLLVFEGWWSSEVLADTRKALVKKYYEK